MRLQWLDSFQNQYQETVFRPQRQLVGAAGPGDLFRSCILHDHFSVVVQKTTNDPFPRPIRTSRRLQGIRAIFVTKSVVSVR